MCAVEEGMRIRPYGRALGQAGMHAHLINNEFQQNGPPSFSCCHWDRVPQPHPLQQPAHSALAECGHELAATLAEAPVGAALFCATCLAEFRIVFRQSPFFYLNPARLAEFRLLEKPWLTHRGQVKGSTAGLRKMPQHHWSGAAAAMGEAGKRGPSAGRSPKQQRRGSSIEEAACCRLV